MSLLQKSLLLSVMALFVLSQNNATAQAETEAEIFTAKNSIHAEFLLPSFNYSLNYGRIFYQKDRLKISASAGFSLLFKRANEPIHSGYVVPVIPAEITAFWGKSKHHLEFGLGFYTYREKSYIFDEDFPRNIREEPYWGKTILPRIGYRYQKPAGGFFFRAGYTPLIGFNSFGDLEKQVNFNPYGFGSGFGVSF